MNKVVYVSSYFKRLGKNVTKKVATGEKEKGFLGGEKDVMKKVTEWQDTGASDSEIDGQRLANDVSEAIIKLNTEGYEVISVVDVTSGNYSWRTTGGQSNAGYGYGYSYTEGVTIIAKKIA
ncbi:hypothetical protein L4C54_24000 [Vibrio lamellibrachiae]|uniref:hypothetical protein n=1 Tax=Vibrio lamellibrachiae TaxID=2910253 RepID=UPI003D12A649